MTVQLIVNLMPKARSYEENLPRKVMLHRFGALCLAEKY